MRKKAMLWQWRPQCDGIEHQADRHELRCAAQWWVKAVDCNKLDQDHSTSPEPRRRRVITGACVRPDSDYSSLLSLAAQSSLALQAHSKLFLVLGWLNQQLTLVRPNLNWCVNLQPVGYPWINRLAPWSTGLFLYVPKFETYGQYQVILCAV